MRLLIGADLVPTESNCEDFMRSTLENIIDKKCLELLKDADYRIFNLETPLVDKLSPILKSGPNLSASTKCVCGLKQLNIDLICLANNHIMDHGENGFVSTIGALKSEKINYVGVGKHISSIKKYEIISINGINVAVYTCAEKEFSIAGYDTPGANPYDEVKTIRDINNLSKKVDNVIILYHGGKEYYRYPSPELQKRCRIMIDAGAKIIVCQHSHCIGCEEKYNNGTIIYGQGNFLFDRGDDEFWKTGLLISVDIQENGYSLKYQPVEKKANSVVIPDKKREEQIMADFWYRSEQIKETFFISKTYSEFAQKMLREWLVAIAPKESILFRIMNKLFHDKLREKRHSRIYSKEKMAVILNFVECEAQRELYIEGMKKYLER